MPELPEVETIVRQLQKPLSGKTIISATISKSGHRVVDSKVGRIFPLKVLQIHRRAKAIVLQLGKNLGLLIRLGMTGHFDYVPKTSKLAGKSKPNLNSTDSEEKYVMVKFWLGDGSVLKYVDVRQFGSIEVFTQPQLEKKLATFGPEPLAKEFTVKIFSDLLSRKKKARIKVTLMDQNFIAGIGNIYAQEALYTAGIRPQRKISTLKPTEIQRLHHSLQKVLRKSIQHHGTTVDNYAHMNGAGDFQNYLQVYGKRQCPKKHLLTKVYLGGRGTYYCALCQH